MNKLEMVGKLEEQLWSVLVLNVSLLSVLSCEQL